MSIDSFPELLNPRQQSFIKQMAVIFKQSNSIKGFVISNEKHHPNPILITRKPKMVITGRSPICFTTAMLSLSIILMMTMIKDCDGWMTPCNGTAECYRIFEIHEELEFLMDTEVNRRILGTTNSKGIGYGALDRTKQPCEGTNCAGKKYNVNGRICKEYQQCH
ncbi:hypothetical protein L2E82_19272 [Cichorium intybus]|uniref:Uncharacterized protein n=1 Tax=Cichorium intybus TaxID=13427 RepID=A0ACB9FB57_CICIN|nr:hypothetical protein L2E82_19272 [Cichorium intybus]